MPALESAHAVAEAIQLAPKLAPDDILVVNLSGRGDKDMGILARELHSEGSLARSLEEKPMAIEFNNKPGLVIYLTAGDPDLATTREIGLGRHRCRRGRARVGGPVQRSVADGPVIQRASERALARGTRLTDVLALAAELRGIGPRPGLVIFSYFNPVLRLGLERFCEQAAHAAWTAC